MSTPTMEELAERAEAVCAEALRTPPLDLVRAMLNEAGLQKARMVLRDSLGHLAEKQRDLRGAQEEERDAKAALEAAVIAAEWELDGRFVSEGNKTFLTGHEWVVIDVQHPDKPPTTERREQPFKKPMTADERAKWKATEARKSPEVGAAAARLRSAEHDVAGYRDALVIAEKSLGVARADLDAAIAHLNALSLALPARKGATT